jgi:glycosyltransferase involved in cell wall biosynthesis
MTDATDATDALPAALPAPSGPVEPQRLLLVLPSTAEFDSRTYRIASAARARGHQVTVLARWKPGLAEREVDPGGYEIIRVGANPGEALPGRAFVRRIFRRIRPQRNPAGASATPAAGVPVRGEAGRPGAETASGVASRSLPRRLASRVVRRWSILLTVRSHARNARELAPQADLIHAMAYMGIPVGHAIADSETPRPKVVYDARDIYMDAGNLAGTRGLVRATIARAERRWARRADRVITVNQPYADVMASRFDVPTPLVVLNCSYRYEPAEPRERRFHDRLGLAPSCRVVLYQGGFSPGRGIEQLFDAIPSIDDAVLVLMGYGYEEATYRERAASPELRGRVHVLPAVPPAELLDWVAAADVVAMPIQPTTLNHRLTTPNKLFEAMAAGVPVVASDLPGMAPIVRETRCGLVVDPTDPAAIAAACREILVAPPDEAAAWRQRALAAAHETYNWENQADRLFAEYSRLTGHRW